jgi:hypothetical protein
MLKDDPTIESLEALPPIEMTVKVTPRIHTKAISIRNHQTGGQDDVELTRIKFIVECGGQEIPDLFDDSYVHWGPREGLQWEETKKEWLAQYGFVRQSIKQAVAVSAMLLCDESTLALARWVEWDAFFHELRDHLTGLYKQYAERFPRGPQDGSYSRQAEVRINLIMLLTSYVIFMRSRFRKPSMSSDELMRTIARESKRVTRGGDTRADAIKQLWADEEVLKSYAHLVDDLVPVWATIKGLAHHCGSEDSQKEWVTSMSKRRAIKNLIADYPKLTEDVLRRAVDNSLKKIDREPRLLAYFHAALELEVNVNGETLSIVDAYLKYEDKPPAPSTLKTPYDKGKALLKQSE